MTSWSSLQKPKFSLPETKISLSVAAIVVLAIGYADLWRGGITLSAFALAIAYCGLIPAAIWAGRSSDPRAVDSEKPSFGAGAVAAALVLALYLVTLAPTTAMWDTSVYIAAAY